MAAPPCSLAFIVPTDERGTTWSTFEYARHSAAALNLKPLILFAHTKQPGVLARWIENFDTVASYDLSRTRFSITNASGGARRLDDIVGWLQSRNARGVYIQTHGSPIKGLPGRGEFNIMALPARGIPLLVHAVFSAKHPWPNATFARISAVVPAASSAIPVVPYPVAPAIEGGPDLRASLGIPADATVFCRHGGMPTFNVPFVRTAVARFAERRPDVYFVLLNTPRLDSKTRANVVHLPAIFDEAKKAAFIRSCDAMLHARAEGETFGMAVAEFSVHNKPVLTYARAPAAARHHLDTLGDRALLYHNEAQLLKMLGAFNRTDAAARDWNAYRPYAVGEVMKTFAKAFGLAELPAECRGAPS